MSALPPKADIVQDDRDVRFVPKADIAAILFDQLICTAKSQHSESDGPGSDGAAGPNIFAGIDAGRG